MKALVSVDTLITGAALLAISLGIITAFYGVYSTAERGIRLIHLKYLSQVIEDRLSTCHIVDGVKVYAPYEVNVFCYRGELCYKDLCVEVRCKGGGRGKIFVVRDCSLLPLN